MFLKTGSWPVVVSAGLFLLSVGHRNTVGADHVMETTGVNHRVWQRRKISGARVSHC